jgi:DNA-binding MarR family transcriptional regulator
MTDVNPTTVEYPNATPQRGPSPAAGEERLVAMVELLFFAYRDFVAEPDAVLDELGFGRAHHRVLHFVNRNPGLRVADLLGILKITKQSLARVLKQLVDQGYIEQATGASDRRERHLHLTPRGRALAVRLLGLQTRRLASALAAAGAGAERAAAAFLAGVIEESDRAAAATLMALAAGERAPRQASREAS